MPIYPHQLRLGKTYTPDAGVEDRISSALAALWTLLEARDVMPVHRRELLSIAIWKYTEAPGVRPHAMYRLPFRTLGAMDLEATSPVQHEHVWTRAWLTRQLIEHHAAGWSRADLAAFMHLHGVACTVTRAEHLLLNACGDAQGWDRYAQVGLEVWDAANGQMLVLPEVAATAASDGERKKVLASSSWRSSGVMSEVILAALASNEGRATPHLRRFLEAAGDENIDLVPKYDSSGNPTVYIKLFDAELDEPTPIAVFVNYNGNLDFHIRAEDVPELMDLDGVEPAKPRYVRVRLTEPGRVDTALELLSATLELVREP